VGKQKKKVLLESLLNNNPFERPVVAFLNEKLTNVRVMYAPTIGENECIQ
jgi:hypothetical protein